MLFFQMVLKEVNTYFYPRSGGDLVGGAASQLVGCCFWYMSGTVWCSWWRLLPCQASKHMFWPGPIALLMPVWLPWRSTIILSSAGQWDHSFTLGEEVAVDGELVLEAPIESGLLGGHDLVCQANHSGWVSAPLRGWGLIASRLQSWWDISGRMRRLIWHWLVGLTWSRCWFWTGGRLRASARSISLPGLYVMIRSYCLQTEEHSLESCRGLLWDFSGWSSWGACGLFPQRMSFHRGTYGIFHNHKRSLRVLSQCWHNGSRCPWGICWQTLWAVLLEWCRLRAPWVMRHTGGWPVWSDHSISGVWGGISATGTWFSGSRCSCSRPMRSNSPFWGGHVMVQCSN